MRLGVAWIICAVSIFINICTVAYYSRLSLHRSQNARGDGACKIIVKEHKNTTKQSSTKQSLPKQSLSKQQESLPKQQEKQQESQQESSHKQQQQQQQQQSSSRPAPTRLEYYWSRIFSTNHDNVREPQQDKCTLIMLTYRREGSLPEVVTSYCNIAMLDKLLVIWNDVENPIPQSILNLRNKCPANKLIFITSAENKMSNRFMPRTEIETECVCIMDDDIIFADSDVEHGIKVWQKFKYLLVGYMDRTRGYTKLKTGAYRYSSGGVSEDQISPDNKRGYSIIIPAVYLHRAYLEMFFDDKMIASELVEYIDDIMNCDDILLSVVVTKFLKDCGWAHSGTLQVEHKSPIRGVSHLNRGQKSVNRGLASRSDHATTRTKCLNYFTSFFGYLPLAPQTVTLHLHM